MTELKEAVAKALVMWEMVWTGPKVTKYTVELWVNLMGDMDKRDFERASVQAMRDLEFWPKPHVILGYAKVAAEERRLENLHLQALPYAHEIEQPLSLPTSRQEVLESMKNVDARSLLVALVGEEK
jgi:hypothetical protein